MGQNFFFIKNYIYIYIYIYSLYCSSLPPFGIRAILARSKVFVSYRNYFQSSWPVLPPQLSLILWYHYFERMLSLTNIILFYIYFLIALPLPYVAFFIYYFILASLYCSIFWWQAEPPVHSNCLLLCDYLFKLILCFPAIFLFPFLCFYPHNLLQMYVIPGSMSECYPVNLGSKHKVRCPHQAEQ